MTILLNKAYALFTAGSIVELSATTEAALIAQGIATLSTSAVTAGAYTTTLMAGTITFAIAATSVVITNPNINATCKVMPVIAQATADATMTGVRCVAGAGLFTVYANAAPTAATTVDWIAFNPEILSS